MSKAWPSRSTRGDRRNPPAAWVGVTHAILAKMESRRKKRAERRVVRKILAEAVSASAIFHAYHTVSQAAQKSITNNNLRSIVTKWDCLKPH